jgi:hypothetical protein
MPVLDAVFIGKIHLPEIGGGPIYPQPPQPGGPAVSPPIYYPPTPEHPWVPPSGQPPQPSHPWVPPQPGYPSHPWVPPSEPPPQPSHPWVPPPAVPTHPIVLPPDAVPPSTPPMPTHPIEGVTFGYALIFVPGLGMKWVAFPIQPDQAPPA